MSQMRVAVVGGTGLVGQHVVAELRTAGHDPVVLARSAGADVRVDLVTGQGLDAALADADVVIDVGNVTTRKRSESAAFFSAATENLLAAQRRLGVKHLLALSIVGIDRVNLAYYEGKRRQEALLLDSGQPVSVLRATQFHEFATQMQAGSPGPVIVLPKMPTQPIAAREVAAALVELAGQQPVGLAPEIAGPREEVLSDMVRRVAAIRGDRRRVLALRLPMAGAGAMANGGALPTGPGPRGQQTFTDWLAHWDRS